MRCRLFQILPLLRPPPPPSVTYCSFSSLPSEAAAATTEILKIGDVLRESRRFSEADVEEYSKVSGDANRVHFDADFARRVAGFEDRVVHGMLVASLFPTVIASHFPGAIYVSQTLHFKLPVYIEDEVIAEVQPVNLRVNKEKFIAKLSTKCFTSGHLVLEGEATAILPTLKLLKQQDK